MNVVVDGLLTHYELNGKGKLVLLLHGWGDGIKSWAGLRAALSRGYQVLAVDLPGFGASQAPKEPWNLDNYAHFIKALLGKLELDQPYAAIGHSNGGAVVIRAISLGAVHPQKLVLLAASGVRAQNRPRALVLSSLAKTGKAATIWLPRRHRQALRERLYHAAGSDMLVMPELQQTYKRIIRQDVQADAATITIPTLLVYGADDTATPISHGRRYEKLIKNSRLLMVPDAGHFLHLDRPEQVRDLVEEFLK